MNTSIFLIILGLIIIALLAYIIISNGNKKKIQTSIDAIKLEITNFATNEFSRCSRDLSTQNRQEVSSITGGIRDEILRSMADLRNVTLNANKQNAEIGATLKQQLLGFQNSAELLGRKTEGLERALSGGGKRQGTWGEAVLEQILTSGGLRRDIDFTLQQGSKEVGIPDAEVRDVLGRHLIIDSKTSLTSYLAACNEDNPEKRNTLLKDHLKSIKKHITELSAKDYISKLEKAFPDKTYLHQVAMFVPSEGAHAAAMEMEPLLGNYAIKRNVAIVTPLTLLGYIRILSLAYQQESLQKSHHEIIDRAEILLHRVNNALSSLDELGKSLNTAQLSYEKVMGLMGKRDGQHSITKPAEDLIKLGIKLKQPNQRLLRQPDINE